MRTLDIYLVLQYIFCFDDTALPRMRNNLSASVLRVSGDRARSTPPTIQLVMASLLPPLMH